MHRSGAMCRPNTRSFCRCEGRCGKPVIFCLLRNTCLSCHVKFSGPIKPFMQPWLVRQTILMSMAWTGWETSWMTISPCSLCQRVPLQQGRRGDVPTPIHADAHMMLFVSVGFPTWHGGINMGRQVLVLWNWWPQLWIWA